jgi:hypothetical protein
VSPKLPRLHPVRSIDQMADEDVVDYDDDVDEGAPQEKVFM